MKVFISVGSEELKDKIKNLNGVNSVDEENNLDTVYELLDYVKIDFLILNRMLDASGEKLIKIANKAKKKNIKVIVLLDELEKSETKKLIAALVAEEVNAFIRLKNFDISMIQKYLDEYPKEFNFNTIATPEIKVVEKEVIKEVIKTQVVRKKIVTCYSADDMLATAEVASDLAILLSKASSDLKILLIDFNNLNPVLDHILGIDKFVKFKDKYEIERQTSLVAMINAINRGSLTEGLFKNLVIREKKYKFDIATGLYDLILEDKITMEQYKIILDMAEKIYDVVIINTNSYAKSEATFIALCKATNVLGITNATYTSIRGLVTVLKTLETKISSDKINVIINNYSKYSLQKSILKELLEGYKITAVLPATLKKELAINEQEPYYKYFTKEDIDEFNNLLERLGVNVTKRKKNKFGKFGWRGYMNGC